MSLPTALTIKHSYLTHCQSLLLLSRQPLCVLESIFKVVNCVLHELWCTALLEKVVTFSESLAKVSLFFLELGQNSLKINKLYI